MTYQPANFVMDTSSALSLVACILHIMTGRWLPAAIMFVWAIFVAVLPSGAFHESFFYGRSKQ